MTTTQNTAPARTARQQRLELHIRRAYRAALDPMSPNVRIGDLFNHLDAPADEVAEVLRHLARTGQVTLSMDAVPEHRMSETDRWSAVWFADRRTHFVAFH